MNSVLDALSLTSGFQLPVTTTAAMSRADKTQTVPDTEPLQVIVIPHSHNDPGWKKTYREYFDDQTTHILSLMVKKLHEYPDMTFIWVESTFLDTWWLNQTLETRSRFKELVDSGRLEIASGMWVAPDEASPHYFALVDQMIEGHYWVKKNLGIVPESSLNYDQFGYSSTMPYLNKLAGIKHVLIKRINRWVKEKLGTQHRMNFRWRQIWDSQGLDDIFAHVDTYEWMSISDSCGPDRPTCMKLDFKEQPDLPDPNKPVPPAGGRIPLETLANSLVEQFRLKNANYKYNVMMLPHGGDFRFDTEYEWDKQYRNMKIFMKYVNERKDFNVQMRFGTLKDFFMEVDRQTEKYGLNYPVVTGDFYSYTENQDYWTGYFTTRQFNKRLGREVLESLRSAELFAAVAISGHVDGQVRQQILSDLVIARKNLGIFQHHDAITGTSKKHVARDYELLLTSAFTSSQRVLATAVQLLLSGDGSNSKLSGLMPLLARPTENRLTRTTDDGEEIQKRFTL
ncbi:alpha-mannosidase 2x-like [Dreissena polymorpha]|uniref:alpha-mannosidase 2x-like n=1 Tax=Dreissena polymorpha TaxID=45954 RepID=UPI00226569BE|nr:alpha-mannosidase 2x-like [Dreissena polymorpha]